MAWIPAGLPPWEVRGGHGRTLKGRCGPHPGWIELPHILLPLTSDRKGKELLMALFLRCVRDTSWPRETLGLALLSLGLRTHRSTDATRETKGNGPGDCAKSHAPLAEVLLVGMTGSGSALPAAGPAQPGCPGKDSTSGPGFALITSSSLILQLTHHFLEKPFQTPG